MNCLVILLAVWMTLLGVQCEDPQNLRDLYLKWAKTLMQIKVSQTNKNKGGTCSSSVEQMEGRAALKHMFHRFQGEGLVRHVWSRWGFYEKILDPVVKGLDKDVKFCIWHSGNQRDSEVCLSGVCTKCVDLGKGSDNGGGGQNKTQVDKLTDLCQFTFNDGTPNSTLLMEAEGIIRSPVNPGRSPDGKLTWDEVVAWKDTFSEAKHTQSEKLEKCSASPEMSLSSQYLLRIFGEFKIDEHRGIFNWEWKKSKEAQKEWERRPAFYAKKLGWLKGANTTDVVICRGERTRDKDNLLVCGWDGVCINSKMLTEESGNEFKELKDGLEKNNVNKSYKTRANVTEYGSGGRRSEVGTVGGLLVGVALSVWKEMY